MRSLSCFLIHFSSTESVSCGSVSYRHSNVVDSPGAIFLSDDSVALIVVLRRTVTLTDFSAVPKMFSALQVYSPASYLTTTLYVSISHSQNKHLGLPFMTFATVLVLLTPSLLLARIHHIYVSPWASSIRVIQPTTFPICFSSNYVRVSGFVSPSPVRHSICPHLALSLRGRHISLESRITLLWNRVSTLP